MVLPGLILLRLLDILIPSVASKTWLESGH